MIYFLTLFALLLASPLPGVYVVMIIIGVLVVGGGFFILFKAWQNRKKGE